jgi:hypothetical protein
MRISALHQSSKEGRTVKPSHPTANHILPSSWAKNTAIQNTAQKLVFLHTAPVSRISLPLKHFFGKSTTRETYALDPLEDRIFRHRQVLINIFFNATTCSHELGLPSWLWRKCNQLLRLGRPWGAVTLSRLCEGWYGEMRCQERP